MLKYTRGWKIDRFLDRLFPPDMIYFPQKFFTMKTTADEVKALPIGALCMFKIKIALLSFVEISQSSYPNRRCFNSRVAVNESSYWSKSFLFWFINDFESILWGSSLCDLEISRVIRRSTQRKKWFWFGVNLW